MSTILVVEDETSLAVSLSSALSEAGFCVHCEREAESAINAANRFDFDAAVVSGGMPELGSELVAQELRARDPELPIFVCTGFDEGSIAKLATQERVLFLEKPVDQAELIWLLQAHIGSLS
jgi:DNA-binding response OmpR family regulator